MTPAPLRILGVTPARGGSKGIPRKNIKPILGRPLLAYTIASSKASRLLTDYVVSSEDDEILKVAAFYGADTVRRPKELAEDATPSFPVIEHALYEMEGRTGNRYDAVIMLQATTPLRSAEDIDGAIRKLMENATDSVISVVPTPGVNPEWMKYIENDTLVDYDPSIKDMSSRQSMRQIYIRNGCIYAAKREPFLTEKALRCGTARPYIMDAQKWVNIDSERDWLLAEAIMSKLDFSHVRAAV